MKTIHVFLGGIYHGIWLDGQAYDKWRTTVDYFEVMSRFSIIGSFSVPTDATDRYVEQRLAANLKGNWSHFNA